MRRILLSILLLFALCAGFSGAASATTCSVAGGGGAGPGDDCYWVGATSSVWTVNTNWSNAPGGTSCTCTPAAGANIHGTNANPLALGGSRTIGDLDLASYTGALAYGANTLTTNKVGASIVFGTGMTVTGVDNTSLIIFNQASGTSTLDGGGLTGPLPGITINAGSTVNLTAHDYIAATASTLTVSNGAFNGNGLNWTMGHVTTANNANTRTLTCGSGTATITATDGGTMWDTRVGAGGTLNLTCNTGTVAFNPGTTKVTIFFGTSDAYNAVQFNNPGTSTYISINSGSSIVFATMGAGPWTQLQPNVGFSVTNASTLTGTLAKPISINGGSVNITINAAGGLTCNYCYVTYITKGTGTLTFNNSFDGNHNVGFTPTSPSPGNSLVGL